MREREREAKSRNNDECRQSVKVRSEGAGGTKEMKIDPVGVLALLYSTAHTPRLEVTRRGAAAGVCYMYPQVLRPRGSSKEPVVPESAVDGKLSPLY